MARLIRLGLLASASWLTLAGAADAGPVAGLIAAASAAFGGSVGAALLTAGKQLVVGVILSLAARAFVRTPEQKRAVRGVQGQVTIGGDTPLRAVLGRYATQGHHVHGASWGKVDKTPNAYYTRLHLLSILPGASLARVLVEDQYVTLGAVMDGTLGYPVLEYRKPAEGSKPAQDRLWVRFYDGFQTAADPGMLDTLGDAAERPWLEDMIGRGCVLAKVTALYKPAQFPAGLGFETVFELADIPLYDPRRDSTAGGSGPQRWPDRSTWEPSVNPIVGVYNIMRGLWYEGELLYGPGLPAHRLPLSSWAAAMNACDASASIAGGGTEPAYRFGVELDLSGEPRDAIAELLKVCHGDMVEYGGRFYVRAGAPAPAVFAFTDADLIITAGSDFDPFPGLEETFNGYSGTYPDPDSGWETVEAPVARSEEYRARDGGRRQDGQLEFPAAPYPLQVQRLMEAILHDGRRFRTHVVTLGPEALKVAPLDTVSWSSAHNGYEAKLFDIRKRRENEDASVTWVIREWDPDDYSWSSDRQRPVSTGYLGRAPLPDHPMTGWSVAGDVMTDSLGQPRRAIIRLTWPTTDIEGMARVGARVRVKHQTSVIYSAIFEDFDEGAGVLAGSTILGDVTYEVQGWMVSAENERTPATDWMEVTTPEVNLGPSDFSPGAVTLELLSEDVVELIEENSSEGFGYVELATAARDAAIAARDEALEAADDAAGDAAAAATSATSAQTRATQAANSAAAASASLVQAQTARDAAQGHATAAGTSATTAAGHASAAATSASTATTRRNEAQSYRDAAQTAATASTSARDQAETAVDDAAGYASAAQQSLTQATAQADLAQTRAQTAQTAASQASASAAEASTFAGVSASLGAGNLLTSDVVGQPGPNEFGRWVAGSEYELFNSGITPSHAGASERSLLIRRHAVLGSAGAWEGGWRSGSLRGRALRYTGWARTIDSASDAYFGIVRRDSAGNRMTGGRTMVLAANANWTFFDKIVQIPAESDEVEWRPEVFLPDSYGQADFRLYRPRIEVVDQTAREASASLSVETTARADADELMARFLVRTQLVSGSRRVITGFGFQSSIGEGGAPESEFEILADKFKVVAPPSVSGQPAKTMFSVQNVDGEAEVAIAGRLFADDAFLTRMIGANQVTRDAWSASAAEIDLSDADGWTTIRSVALTRTSGRSCRVDFSGSWRGAGDNPPKFTSRLMRGSTQVADWAGEIEGGRGQIGHFWIDGANVSGSQTYRWELYIPTSPSGLTIERPIIYAVELKR